MTAAPPPPPPGYGQGPYVPPRKWYTKKRWIISGVVVVVIIIIAAASGGGGGDKKPTADSTPDSTAATTASSSASSSSSSSASTAPSSPKPSQGAGAKDASADVHIGKLSVDKQFGVATYTVPVTITNHSSKRSDYSITIALESADGKTQIDTADLFEQNIEPGQSKNDSGDFLSLDTGSSKPPAGAKLVLQEVQRTESF